MALRYFFDVVCPYSYIMGFEVEEAEDEGLVEIEWLPFELRPAPAPLPEPRGEYIRGHWRAQVYRLADGHGVEIHVPRYQPRSTLALTLHAFAVEAGKGRPFRNAAHRAFFVDGLDVSDDAVLREAAEEAGLDADAAMEAAWDPAGLVALRATREEALRLGVHGVPTVATAEEVLFYGAAPPGRLREMLIKGSGAWAGAGRLRARRAASILLSVQGNREDAGRSAQSSEPRRRREARTPEKSPTPSGGRP